MSWLQVLALAATLAAMFAIVPLMVWGGTGSWRRAVQALRQYLGVMLLLSVGAVVGLLMALAEFIDRS